LELSLAPLVVLKSEKNNPLVPLTALAAQDRYQPPVTLTYTNTTTQRTVSTQLDLTHRTT